MTLRHVARSTVKTLEFLVDCLPVGISPLVAIVSLAALGVVLFMERAPQAVPTGTAATATMPPVAALERRAAPDGAGRETIVIDQRVRSAFLMELEVPGMSGRATAGVDRRSGGSLEQVGLTDLRPYFDAAAPSRAITMRPEEYVHNFRGRVDLPA